VLLLQLLTQLISLPPSAIRIKCYNFDGPTKSSGQSVSLGLLEF
jgi:hypothetical protein